MKFLKQYSPFTGSPIPLRIILNNNSVYFKGFHPFPKSHIEKQFCLFQVCAVETFACPTCSKTFKTQGGLSKTFENFINGITVNDLWSLLKYTQANISQDLNYSNDVRNKIYLITQFVVSQLHNDISPIYETLVENS